MVKFWEMLIAMFAMMAMVVVPTSCGDDDDDDEKNGSNTSSNPIAGKMFVYEDEDGVDVYVFEEEIMTRHNKYFGHGEYHSDKTTYRYEVLSNGLLSFRTTYHKYQNGKLYESEIGVFEGDDYWLEAEEDKTGRSPEQIIKEWEDVYMK